MPSLDPLTAIRAARTVLLCHGDESVLPVVRGNRHMARDRG